MNTLSENALNYKNKIKKRSLNYFFISCIFMILPVLFYGMRPLIIFGISIASSLIAEIIGNLLQNKSFTTNDYSCISTGALMALLLPVTVPLWIPVVANVFAIWAVKMPLGGIRNPVFCEPAAAIAFITVCWPSHMFYYIAVDTGTNLPLFENITTNTFDAVKSSAALIKLGASPAGSELDFLLGRVPSVMGGSLIIMIFAALIYLCVKKVSSFRTIISFVIVYSVFVVISNIKTGNILNHLMYEFSAGAILFYVVFLLADNLIAPKGKLSSIAYGAIGALFMLFVRNYGYYETGMCFTVLFMNAVSPLVQKYLNGWHTVEDDDLTEEDLLNEEDKEIEIENSEEKLGFEYAASVVLNEEKTEKTIKIQEENIITESEEKEDKNKGNIKVRVISKKTTEELLKPETDEPENTDENKDGTIQQNISEKPLTKIKIRTIEKTEEVKELKDLEETNKKKPDFTEKQVETDQNEENAVNKFIKDKINLLNKEKITIFSKKKDKFEELKKDSININLADPMRMSLDEIELNNLTNKKIRVLNKEEKNSQQDKAQQIKEDEKTNDTKQENKKEIKPESNIPVKTDITSEQNLEKQDEIKIIKKEKKEPKEPNKTIKIPVLNEQPEKIKPEISKPEITIKEPKTEQEKNIIFDSKDEEKDNKNLTSEKSNEDIAKMISEHKIRIIKKNEENKVKRENKKPDMTAVNQIDKEISQKSDIIEKIPAELKKEYKIRVISSKLNDEKTHPVENEKSIKNIKEKVRIIDKKDDLIFDKEPEKNKKIKTEEEENKSDIRVIKKNDPEMLKQIEENLPKVTVYDQKDRIRVIAINEEADDAYVSVYSKQRLDAQDEKVRVIKKNERTEEDLEKPLKTNDKKEKIRIISTNQKSKDAEITYDSYQDKEEDESNE